MGNWTIVITGIGSHDNGLPYDAEASMRKAVADLKDGGHQQVDGMFVAGQIVHREAYGIST